MPFFFFLPLTTNAPIYHYPYATIGLIGVNAAMFLATAFGGPLIDPGTQLELMLGLDEINPVQWVTSNFMHANILHLAVNMLFLWTFGLVVEGKLGSWPFLGIYLGIGIITCAIEQAILYDPLTPRYALGASGILFGLMGISLVWAPKNDVTCTFVLIIVWFTALYRAFTFDVSVLIVACIFGSMESLAFAVSGFSFSGAAAHLLGLVIGIPLALVMLRLRWVDCEGWDVLAVWSGKAGPWQKKDKTELEKEAADIHKKAVEQKRTETSAAFHKHLRDGRALAAYRIWRQAADADRRWQLDEEDLLALVEALKRQRLEGEMVLPLIEFIRRFPHREANARLLLAKILLSTEKRPRQALAVLAKLAGVRLSDAQAENRRKLTRLAEQMAASTDHLELEPEDW